MEARVVTDIQESTKVAPGRPVLSSHEHTTTSATVSMTLFRHFRYAFTGSHSISSTREQKNSPCSNDASAHTEAFLTTVANGKEA